MIATVRALTGNSPRAYIGDSTRPEAIRTRSLAEETARVFRARVANPRWIEAMKRHGYKGAFEFAATVDYVFGYDATAGVVEDWMYDTLTRKYVLDEEMREFFGRSNPWAPHRRAPPRSRRAQAVGHPGPRHPRRPAPGLPRRRRRPRRPLAPPGHLDRNQTRCTFVL